MPLTYPRQRQRAVRDSGSNCYSRPLRLPNGLDLILTDMRAEERVFFGRALPPGTNTVAPLLHLLDIAYTESGGADYRIPGKSAAQWLADVRLGGGSFPDDAGAWINAVVTELLSKRDYRDLMREEVIARKVELPPFESRLQWMVERHMPDHLTSGQWLGTLQGLATKGYSSEELSRSGLLDWLSSHPQSQRLARQQLLDQIDLDSIRPEVVTEVRREFRARSGWSLVDDGSSGTFPAFAGLPSKRGCPAQSQYYKHLALGWQVHHLKYQDLISNLEGTWVVLDHEGQWAHRDAVYFCRPQDALSYAEFRMSEVFSGWSKDLDQPQWNHYALPSDYDRNYREYVIRLPNYDYCYWPIHFNVQNGLAHLRTSKRYTQSGKRILLVEELQSDWMIDVTQIGIDPPPLKKDWQLLAVKAALAVAQREGLSGVAFISQQMVDKLWFKERPPQQLYARVIPQQVERLARALSLPISHEVIALSTRDVAGGCDNPKSARVSPIRAHVRVEDPNKETRLMLSDLQGIDTQCLTIAVSDLPTIRRIPIWGVGDRSFWCH